jgi:hypothetical protein
MLEDRPANVLLSRRTIIPIAILRPRFDKKSSDVVLSTRVTELAKLSVDETL